MTPWSFRSCPRATASAFSLSRFSSVCDESGEPRPQKHTPGSPFPPWCPLVKSPGTQSCCFPSLTRLIPKGHEVFSLPLPKPFRQTPSVYAAPQRSPASWIAPETGWDCPGGGSDFPAVTDKEKAGTEPSGTAPSGDPCRRSDGPGCCGGALFHLLKQLVFWRLQPRCFCLLSWSWVSGQPSHGVGGGVISNLSATFLPAELRA